MKTRNLSILIARGHDEHIIYLPIDTAFRAILSAIRSLHPGYKFVESWEAV